MFIGRSTRLPQRLQAWLKTNPFTNPAAPAGPGYMPKYRTQLEAAKPLHAQAAATFEEGYSGQ